MVSLGEVYVFLWQEVMNASRIAMSFGFPVAMNLAASNLGQITVFSGVRMGTGGFLTVTSSYELCFPEVRVLLAWLLFYPQW